jgi:two-component system, NarL family, response regulator LiaR
VTPETILKLIVIEDCKLVRLGLESLLFQHDGFTLIAEASDCKEAQALLQRIETAQLPSPDIVIVDIGLPDGSGLDVMARYQAECPEASFVVLTSHESPEELKHALQLGASAYCLKRISTPVLMDVIQAVHSGALWVDAHMAHHVSGLLSSRLTEVSPSQLNASQVNVPVEMESVSERELLLLKLLVEGLSNADIARAMFISVHTVKYYISNLLTKLGARDRVQLAVRAVRLGLIQ